jgi:hypothetical protein
MTTHGEARRGHVMGARFSAISWQHAGTKLTLCRRPNDSQCRYGMHCSICSLAKERRSLGKLRVLIRWHDFTTAAALYVTELTAHCLLEPRHNAIYSLNLYIVVFSKMLTLLYMIETSNVTKVYCPQQLTSQRAKLRASYSVIHHLPWRYWKQIKQ